MRRALFIAFWLCALPGAAFAQDAAELSDAQKAQLEALRQQIANQIQLQAYDLVDELVYGWTQTPVFSAPTPVVLADVSVPVGFGSGLQALIETHVADVVTKNPRGNVQLAHCPACTELIVYSGAKGTVVSRGVDQPEALVKIGAQSRSHHALFLDFEAEGSALVLRARITSLDPALPIVYARTLSSSTSSAALLRSGDPIKSAQQARQEYLDALSSRGLYTIPLRVAVRTYADPNNPDREVRSFPFIWVNAGIETALNQARAWTGGISVGGTWMPETQNGFMAQARVARLLSGSAASLTRPDLYATLGASIIAIQGPGAYIFGEDVATAQLIRADDSTKQQEIFASFMVGLELRVKNRIAAGVFLETSPALTDSPNIGNYVDFGFIQFQSFGAEVSFCF